MNSQVHRELSPETASAAVAALQAQLGHALGALDSLDRKATLLPPFLIGLAGLLLPDGPYSWLQVLMIGTALVTGVVAVTVVYRQVQPGEISIGANVVKLVEGMDLDPREFHHQLAISLRDSIETIDVSNRAKASSLRQAMGLAGSSTLFLVLARLAVGVG